MEDSKPSESVIEILLSLNKRCDVNSQRTDGIEEQLHAIEETIQKIFCFIEFHLIEVPIKYRKAGSGKEEYLYFKPKRETSEASSSPSQSQDSHQSDKIDAPSPFSDELPDHKSPPFQT
jgi:hypothetical protein